MTFKPVRAVLASLAAAATLAAGFAGTGMAADTAVSAADLAKKQPLTVNADADISSKTLVAIRLASYAAAQYALHDGENVISGYDLADAGYATAINDAIAKAGIDTAGTKEQTAAYETTNPMAWVATNLLDSTSSPWAGQLRNFLDQLKNEQAIRNASGTALAQGSNANTMTADVDPGIYIILDRTAEGQASIAMMNGTGINGMTTLKADADGAKTYKLGEVEYKVSDVTAPVKKIVEDGQLKDTNETAIGKTVNYKVTAKVPNWTGYDHYYLALNDTMSRGLTFNNNSVKATVAGKTVTVKTVTIPQTDGSTIVTFLFAPTSDSSSDIVLEKDNYLVDADIVVTYSATVNKNLSLIHI